MQITSFKNFIHFTYLKKEVLNFIINFIDENKIAIEDILLKEDEVVADYFSTHLTKNRHLLTYLLKHLLESSSLYEQHKDKVEKILSLGHLVDNQQYLNNTLLESAKGRQLIQQNKQYQNKDIDETFKGLLREASSDIILKFISENRKSINIDIIYDTHASFRLSFIETLERLRIRLRYLTLRNRA